MSKIILTGNPLSTNHVYKSTCRNGYPCVYMSNDGKNRKGQYYIESKGQWKKCPLENQINLAIELFFKDKKKYDCDNYCKLVLDSMQGIVYQNDNQIMQLTIKKNYDKNNPRVEVEIL